MARRARKEDERSMDSLMDAMTNVVGVLLLILIVSSLGITAAVKKVVENLPEVTEEELQAMKVSRDKSKKNLQDLEQTQTTLVKNEMTDQEATTLLAELEDFEKNNKDLADKTSDIEEWKAKVEEAEKVKEERDAMVLEADKKDRELAAILAQTPEAKVIAAKEIMMPNPRMADPESRALYAVCKFGKLYFIGDPYEHCLKVQQVIDQNFTDLAYTGKAIGSYTYAVKDTKKNENDYYLPVYEKVRLSRREKEALAAWDGLKLNMKNRVGEDIKETTVLKRIVGADDEAELAVHKFRFDLPSFLRRGI
jgi:vacuolar-type H+-ATPase subunit I/STV1